MSIERLVEEIWAENAPSTAVNLMQSYVSAVRRTLGDAGGQLLRTQAPGYQLVLSDEDVDVRRFETLIGLGRKSLADGGYQARRAAAALGGS